MHLTKTATRFFQVIHHVIPTGSNVEYQKLYDEVRRISNAHDLMGLRNSGCPDDEYDPETSKILPLLDKSNDVTELAIGIATIYSKMFGEAFNPTDKWIIDMSKDIFQLKEMK